MLRALLRPKFFMKASSGAKKKTMAVLKIRIRWSVSAGSRSVSVSRLCLCAMCVCVPAAGKVPPPFFSPPFVLSLSSLPLFLSHSLIFSYFLTGSVGVGPVEGPVEASKMAGLSLEDARPLFSWQPVGLFDGRADCWRSTSRFSSSCSPQSSLPIFHVRAHYLFLMLRRPLVATRGAPAAGVSLSPVAEAPSCCDKR